MLAIAQQLARHSSPQFKEISRLQILILIQIDRLIVWQLKSLAICTCTSKVLRRTILDYFDCSAGGQAAFKQCQNSILMKKDGNNYA